MKHDTRGMGGNALPFSPVFAHCVTVRWSHDSPNGYYSTPLMDLAQKAYRSASWYLVAGLEDLALRDARTGRDLEYAYMERQSAEHKAGVR